MSESARDAHLDRMLQLLDRSPADPNPHDGYLDLLDENDATDDEDTRESEDDSGNDGESNNGRVQSFWLSDTGSMLYDGLIRAGFGFREHVGPLVGQRVLTFLDVPGRLQIGADATVLDVGSGPGNITRDIASGLDESGLVMGIDISPAMLKRAVTGTTASNVVYARADAAELPFRDATVDAVSCSACLHLLPDPYAALDEMRRVLRPGGSIALTAPGGMPGKLRKVTDVLGQAGGIRLFDPGMLRTALEERAFESINDRSNPLLHVLDATKPN